MMLTDFMDGKWSLWFIGGGAILDFECITFTLLVQCKDKAVDEKEQYKQYYKFYSIKAI
jgi:hypothetical protein